ncbi:MAG: hypothetical protein M0P61_03775 [Ignavibacteriaceae bacterium]|jgi:hypothetical protein|nr:hypothetical protein [Ignavibacteriaceae bacterium]
MKSKVLILVLVLLLTLPSFTQQNSNKWSKLDYLIGNWKGEGSGKPGQGDGTFSFKLDLDKNILVRTSHSEYPASEGRPAANYSKGYCCKS